ncbi:hypothetical protein ASC93_20325 [Massilia sp. Root335]|nr:hypothetical protein ASC93_20325 [Massilia sp. Root335]
MTKPDSTKKMTTAAWPGHGNGCLGKASTHRWDSTTREAAPKRTRSRYTESPSGMSRFMMEVAGCGTVEYPRLRRVTD